MHIYDNEYLYSWETTLKRQGIHFEEIKKEIKS